MKVFDGFMYHNKPEMLELHLENLDPVVEVFVMVQSTRTFHGIRRRVVTLEELGLERFSSKVIQVSFSLDAPLAADHRETFQRNMISSPLKAGGISDDDLVIISDLDEIVDAKAVERLVADPRELYELGKVRFGMRFHYYYLDCLLDDSLQPWRQCVGVVWNRLKDSSCQQERMMNLSTDHDHALEMPDAGWHLSWFGTSEEVRQTLATHVDPSAREWEGLTVVDVVRIRQDGRDIFSREWLPPLKFVDDLPTLPEYITRNIDHYRDMGWFRKVEDA